MKVRSLRVRLALWGLLLLGVTQMVASIVLYGAIARWLETHVDDGLRLTAVQVSAVLYDPDEAQPLDLADVRLKFGAAPAVSGVLSQQAFVVRLVALDSGVVLAASAGSLPAASPLLPDDLRREFVTMTLPDGGEMRLHTLPLSYAPGLALQVGTPLEDTRAIQGSVLLLLAALTLVIGTLAPLSGWFLANRALVPIRAIARTAAEVSATDMTRRLDLSALEIELEQLGATFNAMLARIEQAFWRQQQFTADAAHELRTPLSIMLTGLDVTLSRERSATEYRAVLVSVQEEAQRLTQLANTLLLLARADTARMEAVPESVDLTLMLHAAAAQYAAAAQTKQVSLRCDVPPGLRVTGDEARLIQVVVNLLDNALKYTPNGGEVLVSARAGGGQVEIAIADSGPGIPAAEHARIFDRFYRTDASRSRAQGGFGLGLSIVRDIVRLHHGAVRVESAPGRGARFVVTLPAVR